MIGLLRFLGVINAATWFGSVIFFTVVAAPALFTPEMKRTFGDAFTGIIARGVLERFFVFQYCCALIAIIHQVAEWLYLGKAMQRLTVGVIAGTLALSLAGGVWLQPKLLRLHSIKYSSELYHRELYTPLQKQQAAEDFRAWHHVAWTLNLVALVGLTFYLWRLTNSGNGTRFTPANKFRS